MFGYYIEVAKGQVDLVPDTYIRKQTLSTGERYITEELKELENTILTAKDRLAALEYDLFCELRNFVASQAQRVQQTAQAVAAVDVLCSLASVAVNNHYCKPEIDLSGEVQITAGRHPVVEQVLKDALFVPNDTNLSPEGGRVAIITGPNMAGKSTYMRQVALIVLMAQMGSFVPASAARIGIVDKLFTRIGASGRSGVRPVDVHGRDERGRRHSEKCNAEFPAHSGRNWPRYLDVRRDGHCARGARILRRPEKARREDALRDALSRADRHRAGAAGVKNFNIAVKKRKDEMIFLRKIVPGAADDSYGVEVAKMAGLPERVIVRARALLKELEGGAPQRASGPNGRRTIRSRCSTCTQTRCARRSSA